MRFEFSQVLKSLNLQLFKVISKSHRELGIDLTPIQGTIIIAISESSETLCQKQMKQFVSCNKSTLSSILNTMEKKGLIYRVVDELDTRKKVIELTEKSKNLIKKIKKDKQEIEKGMTSGIDEKELETFYQTLNKMLKNLERM